MDESQFRYGKSAPFTEALAASDAKDAKDDPAADRPQIKAANGDYAAGVLKDAIGSVRTNHSSLHGELQRSFALIAELWSSYLRGRHLPKGASIRAIDVVQMMTLTEIARSIDRKIDRSCYVQSAAYSAIAGELSATEF